MIKNLIRQIIPVFFIVIILTNAANAQNSLLVNFGSDSCNASGSPVFSLIKNPFDNSPFLLTNCNVANQVPDIFSVFIAYNPKNNKLYLADIRSGNTKIWALDIGLPANINCPATLSNVPDYTYSYVSNNFEFDNNGDLWSFSNYNDTLGQCHIDKFDVNNGNVINTRVVQFPAGNFPTNISSGDLTILPNGRMFATLGSDPSRLYEIINYNSTTTNATAIYLTTLPQNCFGIAYLNGQLEITGTNFSGNCYYYKYNFTTNVLDSAVAFQQGQLPIDNTSITPSVGVTKQLVNATKINGNTADIGYDIYVKNLGNVSLNNINVSDNLERVYGKGNVSDIIVSFLPGENPAGLVINSSYNGSSDTDLLVAGQSLANQTSTNIDYFFKLRLSFRTSNLHTGIYENSAIANATIGSVGTASFINVSDSSNNGNETVVDPNNNGNAGDPGENNPTPFDFGTLPVKFISINASLIDNVSAMVSWAVATPAVNSNTFEVEYSFDGRTWNDLKFISIINTYQSKYQFLHSNIPPGNLYYRIKETDIDGAFTYSNIVLLRNNNNNKNFIVSPNPANNFIDISIPYNGAGKTKIILYDAVGRQIIAYNTTANSEKINTTSLPGGTYILKIETNQNSTSQKIMIMHR